MLLHGRIVMRVWSLGLVVPEM
ncbi:hypothetical protein N7501_002913 [Penicillium viridicatum]|nr:hypothetical protein N7501_002913 [Penicillium viridicatum]